MDSPTLSSDLLGQLRENIGIAITSLKDGKSKAFAANSMTPISTKDSGSSEEASKKRKISNEGTAIKSSKSSDDYLKELLEIQSKAKKVQLLFTVLN